jgi:predicted regulator of Ras-like GTPase activity (Roadblock/LC7/MglB family)
VYNFFYAGLRVFLSSLFWRDNSYWFFERTESGVVAVGKSRVDQLMEHLRNLQSGDVEAAAIVSVDGLSMASLLPPGIEEDRVSAMSAAMLSLGERIAGELSRGELEQVNVKGDSGYVILTSVGEEAVLTVLCPKDTKLGLVLLDVTRAVKELEKIV